MIRFVDVGNQIGYGEDKQGNDNSDVHQFCFYCTVKDVFLSFGEEMFFDSKSDFLKYFKEVKHEDGLYTREEYLERLTNHITDKFNF